MPNIGDALYKLHMEEYERDMIKDPEYTSLNDVCGENTEELISKIGYHEASEIEDQISLLIDYCQNYFYKRGLIDGAALQGYLAAERKVTR